MADPAPLDLAPPAPERPHVLVVDDDRRLRQLLSRYLSDHGFAVSVAADAAEAAALRRQILFDLMVMDIMMPGASGLEATRAIREEEDAIPILLLTARDQPEDRIRGLEAGADDYLPKPFEPRELVLRIHAILKRVARPPVPPPPGVAAPPLPAPLQLGRWRYDPQAQTLTDPADPTTEQRLTQTEAALLTALTRTPHENVAREALMERARLQGGARSVDVLVTRLRRKIEEDARNPRVLVTVRGGGYALRPGPLTGAIEGTDLS